MAVYAGNGKLLRQAAKSGEIETVRSLLVKGVDVNALGKKGSTPVYKAAKAGHLDIVQLLLFYGANPDLKNNKGQSAVDIAKRYKDHTFVSVMTDGIKEQELKFPFRKMRPIDFSSLMKKVFLRRNYSIKEIKPCKIIAGYKKSRRQFRVVASIKGEYITLQFLRGFGARKTNYLLNLRKDLLHWKMKTTQ